jgi:hypothetical protein
MSDELPSFVEILDSLVFSVEELSTEGELSLTFGMHDKHAESLWYRSSGETK